MVSTQAMSTPLQTEEAGRLLDALLALRTRITRHAAARLSRFARDFPEGPPPSAVNLAHYLALRTVDLRPLQSGLTRLGLSSLGRSESHVMTALDQVIRVLEVLTARGGDDADRPTSDFESGPKCLAEHARSLFGPPPTGRDVRIMVTLPTEAAREPGLVQRLVATGMDVARINCAHDDPEAWSRMIRHVREASEASGRPCRIQMDLAGHKLRTGTLAPAPPVLHLRPVRDALGRVLAPATLALVADTSAPGSDAALPRLALPAAVLARLQPGDRLRFRDTRGKRRSLQVTQNTADGLLAQCEATCYLNPDTRLSAERMAEDGLWHALARDIPPGGFLLCPVEIRLHRGDRLSLTREAIPGEPARLDAQGHVIAPAHVSCTTPQALERLTAGQAVWIDDGKLGGVVEAVDAEGVHLSITHCRPQGVRLQADKGLNFPGADLGLPPLTARDLEDLDFVAAHADLVGYSFVETREDMQALIQALSERGASRLGIVAKIETQRALAHLPDIILSTIGRHPLGIMIARGDLAVEIGGERMAEIQEELLWLCEAAHVPVIWATQVLETLAKKGVVTRPEMTDAAMSGRAECVMLNKGPYIVDAVHTLDGILRRMQEHQRKKTSRLRALRLAGIDQDQE
ncbi:Pyruvate kinase [Thioalkalivibrio sulfidiphilus HL-EbGr7]|uniref:pyruvate kinase n=2 Tax=Thioalkalivibrio TaxID=106633 RepID=B8GQM3_THISH|nr:Pyruvate kinase [Thioalkalivibrio sulfidiphilus HL-EbGr7]